MSIKLITEVWESACVTPTAKLVLLALADWAKDDGSNIYPSVDHIAWKTNVSTRQVQRILSDFRSKGILVVERKATQHYPATYRMDVTQIPRQEPFVSRAESLRGDTVTPLNGSRGAKVAPLNGHQIDLRGDIVSPLKTPGVTSATSRGDKVSPEPLVEPLVKNKPLHLPSEDGASTGSNGIVKRNGKLGVIDKITLDAIQTLEPLVNEGQAFDLEREVRAVYTEAWQAAVDADVNAKAVGTNLCAFYYQTITDEKPDYGLIGRLVGKWGKLALTGIAEALARGVEGTDPENPDPRAWMKYAHKVCERKYREAAIRAEVEAERTSV